MARVKQVPTATPKPIGLTDLSPFPASGEVLAHSDLTLLEVSDAADLQALLLDARVNPFVMAVVSSTQALVLPQHSKALLEALRKAGHTPKVRSGMNRA
jgi:hypothetical protein